MTIRTQTQPTERHWVGDGFFVSTLFSPIQFDPQRLSPFVLLDYAAPRMFSPTTQKRGVGEHPHRGFETVTIAYQGEVAHRDSGGGGGIIGPGEVQWMTAGSGVVHEEFHSERFAREGGMFEMVQLWVNLPKSKKMSTPRYQALTRERIPELTQNSMQIRVYGGAFRGTVGPARTHSPITLIDLAFEREGVFRFSPEDLGRQPQDTLILLQRSGSSQIQSAHSVDGTSLLLFDPESSVDVQIEATEGTQLLVLAGEPLREPVVAHGPFVMNTRAEIVQAINDFNAGKMGRLSPEVLE
jgi:quercetin 2,3-dioxygenase